jgi:FPC/CPF motif-containing protein YcgG
MLSTTHQAELTVADEEMKTSFIAFVADPAFPCLGAKAALNSGSQILRVYQELGAEQCATELAPDLEAFIFSDMRRANAFATFVAMFREPCALAEKQFEELLWLTLQQLHDIDIVRHAWNAKVSSDTANPRFAFSFASEPLYVVGLHSGSSRRARRFRWPTLVFNPHEQFDRLRQDGNWTKMQQTIRRRETAVQGFTNPMLSDFGEESEARQYSGRAVDADWSPRFNVSGGASEKSRRCPFSH